jgi:hypothetical protein
MAVESGRSGPAKRDTISALITIYAYYIVHTSCDHLFHALQIEIMLFLRKPEQSVVPATCVFVCGLLVPKTMNTNRDPFSGPFWRRARIRESPRCPAVSGAGGWSRMPAPRRARLPTRAANQPCSVLRWLSVCRRIPYGARAGPNASTCRRVDVAEVSTCLV